MDDEDPVKLDQEIRMLVRQLRAAQQEARELGLFPEDRELLECLRCDLVEDLGCDQRLTTFQRGDPGYTDTSMRFQEVQPGMFRCPQCGATLMADTGDDLDFG